MYGGSIIGTADPHTTSREAIGLLMAGVRPPAPPTIGAGQP